MVCKYQEVTYAVSYNKSEVKGLYCTVYFCKRYFCMRVYIRATYAITDKHLADRLLLYIRYYQADFLG